MDDDEVVEEECDWEHDAKDFCCLVHETMARINHLRFEHGYELKDAVSAVIRNSTMEEFVNIAGDALTLVVNSNSHEDLCEFHRSRNNL